MTEHEEKGWTLSIESVGRMVGIIWAESSQWHFKAVNGHSPAWVGSGTYDCLEDLMADLCLSGFTVVQQGVFNQGVN